MPTLQDKEDSLMKLNSKRIDEIVVFTSKKGDDYE